MAMAFMFGFTVAAIIAFALFVIIAVGIDRMVKDGEFAFVMQCKDGKWKVTPKFNHVMDKVIVKQTLTPHNVVTVYDKK